MRAKWVSWDGSAESRLSGRRDKPDCPTPNQITTQQQSQASLTGRMNGLCCCTEAQGIALFNTPVSHSEDQYTIRPWLYPHLINLSIRIEWACHGVQGQTDKELLPLKTERVFGRSGGFWHSGTQYVRISVCFYCTVCVCICLLDTLLCLSTSLPAFLYKRQSAFLSQKLMACGESCHFRWNLEGIQKTLIFFWLSKNYASMHVKKFTLIKMNKLGKMSLSLIQPRVFTTATL